MQGNQLRKILLFLFIVVTLAACRQVPTPMPNVVAPTATEDTVAQIVPSPTATLAQPETATTAMVPATPTPTATNTPQPTPTATPAALMLLTAEDFGDDRNPLTGEAVSDPTVLQRRPIAVKISNYPGGYVRPQSGLGQANLVFEHATEGPITRFTAVIYDETPVDMGPIRSGRLIDLEIPVMYDAAFAYSGSSIGVAQKLGNSSFASRILRTSAPGYFRTGEDKPFEHTLYGNPAMWWEELTERGENRAPSLSRYMAFSEEPPTGGDPAGHINIDYQGRVVADWSYDEESGRYLRWTDGEVHADQNTGAQLSAANVVVVYAIHVIDYSICEFVANDTCQAYSTEIQIWGQGEAVIFRDGQQYPATWRRESPEYMLTFYDAAGNPVPLQIGNSWFQMVPLHYVSPVTVEP